jgi:hypothetical protein
VIQAEAREQRRTLDARFVELDALLEREQGAQAGRRTVGAVERAKHVIRLRQAAGIRQARDEHASAPGPTAASAIPETIVRGCVAVRRPGVRLAASVR